MSGCGLPDGVNGHTMGFAGYVDDAAARTTDDIENKRVEEAKPTTSSALQRRSVRLQSREQARRICRRSPGTTVGVHVGKTTPESESYPAKSEPGKL